MANVFNRDGKWPGSLREFSGADSKMVEIDAAISKGILASGTKTRVPKKQSTYNFNKLNS